MSFICNTLSPMVRDAGSLHRTALSARPVVDLRKFTMRIEKIAKTPSASNAYVVSECAKLGRCNAYPVPFCANTCNVKTSRSISSENVSVTSAM